MPREYAITLHLTMDEYDATQDMHSLTDALRRIAESYAHDDHHNVSVTVEAGAILDDDAPIPTDPADIIAAIREQAAKEYHCKLCGQHITDGKPCGCGARHAR